MLRKYFSILFFICIIALLSGMIYEQQSHIDELNDIHSKSVTNYYKAIEELEYELYLRDKVISKFGEDIKKNVKLLYKSQVVAVTSYSNRECETDSTPNITASNEYVTDFTIAVSRDLYDQGWTFGKLVYINELDDFARIQDLMNERFCKRIDIFNANTKEAISFGKKKVTAYLLDDVFYYGG